MLQFDLSSPGLAEINRSDIDSVQLGLFVLLSRIKNPTPCSVHALRADWSEMQVTWNRAADSSPWRMIPESCNDDTFALENGGSMDTTALATALSVPSGSWQYFNVTAIVDSFMSSPADNHGFAIRSSAELQPQYYASSENPAQELRPRLKFFTNGVPVISRSPAPGMHTMVRMAPEGENFRLDVGAIGSFSLTLFDISGRALAAFRGEGSKQYRIAGGTIPHGMLTAVLKSQNGSTAFRINTIN